MSKKALKTGLAVIGVGVALLLTFIVGLFVYVNATAKPLHPDPNAIPTATHSPALPKWAAAVEQGRQITRSGLTTQNLPGLSVAVGAGGDLVWAEGLGYAELEKRVPVTPATRFRVGDASIALTSAAAGLLLEKNKLNLDVDIQRYVPEFPEKQWPVTLRHLMGHTAGIRNDEGDEEPLEIRCARTVDGLQRFSSEPLRFEPGTRSRYSSYGWILVSAAVEAAAGEPFFTFMRTKIFEPLGMTATRPDAWQEAIPDRATFYFPRFGGDTRYGPELARDGDQSCFAGAGAFLSTPSDLVRYGMAVNGGKLLQPATVELLQTRQRLTSGEETDFGLGWKVETVDVAGTPTRTVSHGTKVDFIGTTTTLLTLPERGVVVAVMTNTSFADTKKIAVELAQLFAQPGTTPASK
jgi:CubicO group peptidase (beta-lactamase class C family)